MVKPITGVLVAALLVVVGCAAPSTSPNSSADTAVPSAPASSPVPTAATANAPAPTAQAPELDTTIVPGERIGPVTRDTTRQDLAALFGESNLSDEDIYKGEGESEPGTIVNLGPERSFTVIWTDETRQELTAVVNFGSAWRTPEGIGVGTPFTELQQKLGQFQLYGFAWDYGGTVVLEGTNLAQYDDSLILRVQPASDAAETSPDDYDAVMGDALFPSTDPHLQSLGITVEELIVSLSPQPE